MIHLVVMTTVRGSVMCFDHKDWKLIIHVPEQSGVITADWPRDLDIDTGAVVDIHPDGTITYPVASASTNESRDDDLPKKCV